jgi:hypothetical protein
LLLEAGCWSPASWLNGPSLPEGIVIVLLVWVLGGDELDDDTVN